VVKPKSDDNCVGRPNNNNRTVCPRGVKTRRHALNLREQSPN